ncbi:MAG: helix-hairpin-helix domain-containing protein [Bacteroidota bacterium]
MIEVLSPSAIWNRLLSVAHRAGFTQNEAGVIVFLAVALLAGGASKAFRGEDVKAQKRPDVRQAMASQDSVFVALSEESASAVSSIEIITSDRSDVESAAEKLSENPGIVSINRATRNELETLPGIGPATAEKIVAYRKEHGKFERIEDIMLVKSIGPKKFEKLRQFITLE